MDEKDKEVLLNAVVNGNLENVKEAFRKHFRHYDRDYFDYKLLQEALKRKNEEIAQYLIYKTDCRVNNPTKEKAEETPLHLAMKLGNPFFVKKLVNNNALVFEKDENGDIPLLAGFKADSIYTVRGLLAHYIPTFKPDNKDAMIHFHIACVTNHNTATHYLRCGFNPNIPLCLDTEEYSGFNPMHIAAEKNYYRLFQELVDWKGDLSIKNAAGLTPLHIFYYKYTSNTLKNRLKAAFQCYPRNQTAFINAEDNNRVSHLHLCCMLDNSELVKVFIEKGANVNSHISVDCKTDPGFTPLHFAVANGNCRVVHLLLENGADSNSKDKEGKTPLHLACKLLVHRKVHIIKALLNHNANPAIADNQGCTPFHMEFYYANNENKIRIFDMLSLTMSEKINYTNNEGLSHFHIACTYNINQVKDFLDSEINVDSSVSSGIYSGYTALHFAALHNQKDIVELLLKKNAQVNIKTTEFQVTPLHLACEFNYAKFHDEKRKQKFDNPELHPIHLDSFSNRTNQFDIINLLLSNGAHVDAKDYQELTPLLYLSTIDKNYCKLNWSYTSSKHKTGIILEISIRLKKIIDILFSNKAEINVSSIRKETILHIISKYNDLVNMDEAIELILNESADINAVDDDGLTPLHVAVNASNQRMVQKLVEHDANVNIRCKNSKIPMHGVFSVYFKKTGYPLLIDGALMDNRTQKIFYDLLRKGSNINIKIQNMVPLQITVENKDTYVLEKLLCNGADINAENSNGESCISSLLRWKNLNESNVAGDAQHYLSLVKYAQVFQIIYIHVQKLLALEHYVSKKVQKICFELQAKHMTLLLQFRHRLNSLINLDNIFYECRKELEKLKLKKLDNCTSLYTVLLKDEHKLTKVVKNDDFVKIVEDEDISKDFPLYNELLKLQFRRGSMRNTLLSSAKEIIYTLLNNIGINLPDLCCDAIIDNLKNEDFANLQAVILPKKSLKRKLSESDESPPSKCKKETE